MDVVQSLIQIPVTVSDTLQTRKSFCYSYRSQLQIQARYAPDTVAILSLIQIPVTVSDTLRHESHSATHTDLNFRYSPDMLLTR